MYWPRLVLTEEEMEYGITKYFDPKSLSQVKRRIYTGILQLTEQQREPTFGFGIARRCKVFGLTASGDLHRFRIQLSDSSGEKYFPDFVAASQVITGYNTIPPGAYSPPSPFDNILGFPLTFAPFIMNPAIVLDPNQVLNLQGQAFTPYDGFDYTMMVCLHVWEYPGMYGTSPR